MKRFTVLCFSCFYFASGLNFWFQLMQRIPFSFSISSRARWKSLVTLALVLGATSLQANAQPEGDSLMVPDDVATGAGVTVTPIETAAQKAERAASVREVSDRSQWRAARQEMAGKDGINEKQNPSGTLAAYRVWLGQHGELYPTVEAEAGIAVAHLQLQSGDKEGASTTLTALWDKLKGNDGGLLVRAFQAQRALQDAAPEDKAKAGVGAQAMLEPLLPRALNNSHLTYDARFVPGREVLQRYADALRAQDKGLEVAAFAQKVMSEAPEHLADAYQNEGGWLYRMTVEALIADARPEAPKQALSWAKLNWVERSFDANSIKVASAVVAQALLAQPKGTELLSQWAKAQKDPSTPNPLKEVALPVADSKALSGWLDTAGQEKKWQQARVSVLLWIGHDHEAMQAAVAGADTLPPDAKAQRQEVMREVARVFKAHDLNLKRANGYLGWVSKPVGDNPIDVFLKEAPVKVAQGEAP